MAQILMHSTLHSVGNQIYDSMVSATGKVWYFERRCDEFNDKEPGCQSSGGHETCTVVCDDEDLCNDGNYAPTTLASQPSPTESIASTQSTGKIIILTLWLEQKRVTWGY